MTDSTIQVPHLAWPLRLGVGGTFATVEQNSDTDVMQGVLVLLSTPIGRQVELPEYGMPEQNFRNAINVDDAVQAVESWQPRATIVVTSSIDTLDDLMQHVQVAVSNDA